MGDVLLASSRACGGQWLEPDGGFILGSTYDGAHMCVSDSKGGYGRLSDLTYRPSRVDAVPADSPWQILIGKHEDDVRIKDGVAASLVELTGSMVGGDGYDGLRTVVASPRGCSEFETTCDSLTSIFRFYDKAMDSGYCRTDAWGVMCTLDSDRFVICFLNVWTDVDRTYEAVVIPRAEQFGIYPVRGNGGLFREWDGAGVGDFFTEEAFGSCMIVWRSYRRDPDRTWRQLSHIERLTLLYESLVHSCGCQRADLVGL